MDSSPNRKDPDAGDAYSSSQRPSQSPREQVLDFSLLHTLVECASDSEDEDYIRGSALSQKMESDPHMFSDGESTTDPDDGCSSIVSLGDTNEQRSKRVSFGDEITIVPFDQTPVKCGKVRTSYFPANLLHAMGRTDDRLSRKYAASCLDGSRKGEKQECKSFFPGDHSKSVRALRDVANAILCAGILAKECGRRPCLSQTALWRHDGKIEVFSENRQKHNFFV